MFAERHCRPDRSAKISLAAGNPLSLYCQIMSRIRQPAGPHVRTASVTFAADHTWRHHTSDDWAQLVFGSRGALTVHTESGLFVVPRHQAVWVPAGVRHDVDVPRQAALRTLYLRSLGRQSLPNTCRVVDITPLLRELLRRIFEFGTLDQRKRQERNLMDVLLDELAVLPRAPIDLPRPRDARAARAAAFLRSSPGERATLSEVARHAGASPRNLERLFRLETGLSFGAWRQRARLLSALRMLAEGASVTKTSFAVGYESTSAFVAAFRRALQKTPGQYFKQSLPEHDAPWYTES
jgi:AraC-like DNA-binding protein/quercetin dioxygenase-like cupin family protein